MVVFEGFRSKFELSGNAVNYRICRYFQPINENAYYQKQFRGLFCFQKKRPANGFLGVAQSPKSSMSGTDFIVPHPKWVARGIMAFRGKIFCGLNFPATM